MNARLPDVASAESSAILSPLEEVGMSGIDVPLSLDEPGALSPVRARADLCVDLPIPHVKGIHMSRLYRLLDAFAGAHKLTPASLRHLLHKCVDSHEECGSQQANIVLDFELTLQRPALVTPDLGGWKSYPIRLEARWEAGDFQLDAWVTVAYSSTCPCSAALSRQLVEQAFSAQFAADKAVPVQTVADWLRDNATWATPHSQRSEARVGVRYWDGQGRLALRELIDLAEAALGTPVQTAVKRADEQAFARLNGQNLMYVEDAARRLQQALAAQFDAYSVRVTHRESLHAHDAVARVSKGWDS
ncbi:GTP cyclohydrolase FolE2 [Variovorax sp. GB1P17]|uniref:GTP cyclohydrolase FolE2 n=1 Tax=Variovorax sp. GB1P17 TaxID=3443740 RepID=UPI003F44841C